MDEVIDTGLDRLKAGGFTNSGTWKRSGQEPPHCEGPIPSEPGVYVFVQGGRIRYVGAAQKRLSSRIKSYERRQRDQSSNRPVHVALTKAVTKTEVVEVYTRVITPPIQVTFDGLPIDYLVGLEAGLIEEFKPAWNRRGRKLVLDEIDTVAKAKDTVRRVKADSRKITVLVKNPKRPGTNRYARFALYRDGMTVDSSVKAGGRRHDIETDTTRKFIRVSR